MSLGKFKQDRFGGETVGRNPETDVTVKNPAVTDGLANIAEAVISFFHVSSERDIFFKAFINSFNESYSSNYNEEEVFGRIDPIFTFRNTRRTIDLSWKIPALSTSEAYENLARVQELVQFLYPNYTNVGDALTMSQSPLVRLKVMNLAQKTSYTETYWSGPLSSPSTGDGFGDPELQLYSSANNPSFGLLGVITSLNVRHNLDDPSAGVIQTKQNTILPKLLEVDISFSVIHEDSLGFQKSGQKNEKVTFQSPTFPYGAVRTNDADNPDVSGLSYNERQNFLKSQEAKRQQKEQDRANAMARNYNGMFGKKRLKKDMKFLANNKDNKDNLRNYDYIESAVRGQIHSLGSEKNIMDQVNFHNSDNEEAVSSLINDGFVE